MAKDKKVTKKAPPPSSSDDSSDSSDSSSEQVKKVVKTTKGSKAAPPAKKVTKKDEMDIESDSSSDSSDSSSSSDKKKKPAKKEEKKPAKKAVASSSSEDSSDDSSSSEEKPKKGAKKVEAKKSKKAASSSSEDSSDDSSSSEEEPKKAATKRKAEEAEPSTPAKKARTESAGEGDGQNKRVFVGNLNFKIDDDSIKDFFKECGEIVSVHWVTDKATGKFYGTGFLEFETAESAEKAVAMAGQDCLGRPIKVDFAQARGDRAGGAATPRTPRAGAAAGDRQSRAPTPKPDGCTTVFLGNLSFNIDDDTVRKVFADCGEIKQIRWVERDGRFSGCGFVEFAESDSTDKAVGHHGENVLGREMRVDYSAPRNR